MQLCCQPFYWTTANLQDKWVEKILHLRSLEKNKERKNSVLPPVLCLLHIFHRNYQIIRKVWLFTCVKQKVKSSVFRIFSMHYKLTIKKSFFLKVFLIQFKYLLTNVLVSFLFTSVPNRLVQLIKIYVIDFPIIF